MAPQARSLVRPRIGPGRPGIVAAMHQRSASSTTISYQAFGRRLTSRCGSLAKIARFSFVFFGAIAQLFDATARGTTFDQRSASGTSRSPSVTRATSAGSSPPSWPGKSSSRWAFEIPACTISTSSRSMSPCDWARPTNPTTRETMIMSASVHGSGL